MIILSKSSVGPT